MKKALFISAMTATVCTLSFFGCSSTGTPNENTATVSASKNSIKTEEAQETSTSITIEKSEDASTSEHSTHESESDTPTASNIQNDEIRFTDITWTVEQGQYNDTEFCLFSYTNNSPFVITDLEMRFEQKEDTSDEQREKLFGELKEEWNMSNEDIAELNLTAHTQKLADPGETISDKPMYLNSFYGPTDYDIFGIMEPASMKISFIGSDERIHSGEIDCQSEKYRDSGKTEVADQWSDNVLAQLLPKPDSSVILVSIDRDDCFWAYAYGMTSVDYEQYIENCQEKGFNVDADTFDFTETSSFYAYDADGNRLSVTYDSMKEELSIEITSGEIEE